MRASEFEDDITDEIRDIYGPYARRVQLFYLQPADSNCPPSTFGCDLGTHRGTLDTATKQAESFYQLSRIKIKIVDETGKIRGYYP